MSRGVKIILSAACLIFTLSIGSAHAQMKGVVGVGLGTVSGIGSPIGNGNTNSQLFTLHAFGLVGPTDWLALVADFTIGLPRSYDGAIAGGETQKVELSSFFFDALAGVYKTSSEGGYLYFGAGFTIATGNREDTIANTGSVEFFKSDPGTSLGFAFGAGVGLPVSDKTFGFLSLRQRFVTANVETIGPNYRATQDVSLGGLDIAAGVAFGISL